MKIASSLSSAVSILKNTTSHWMEDNALRLSAALAYYSIFSIAPLLVLAVGLAGWFFGADAVRGHLFGELRGMIGDQGAQAIQTMVQSTSKPSHSLIATIVGFVTMLVGASGFFGQLKDSLNTIWEVRSKPGMGVRIFIRERFLSFGMVLVIGFLLLVSFLLTAILSGLNHWVEGALKLPNWIWASAGLAISFGVVTILFALIFKVLPDVKIAWRNVWVGAIATALFFELGKFALSIYLGSASTSSSFGSAGAVVLILLWVYYASCILLFGAEFTKAYAMAHGETMPPSEIAEPVTAAARAQQGLHPIGAGVHSEIPRAAGEVMGVGAPSPLRERLTRIFPAPPEPKVAEVFPRSLAEWNAYLRPRPIAGIVGGLGVGCLIGIASEFVKPRTAPPLASGEPVERIQQGSRLIATAFLLLGIRFRKRLMRLLN